MGRGGRESGGEDADDLADDEPEIARRLWYLNYEHTLAHAYGWTREEIGALQWDEVFELVFQIRRQQSTDLLWSIKAAAFAWSDPVEKRKTLRQIKELAQRPSARKSIYDRVDEDTRIRMIGSGLMVKPVKFARTHPRLMAMLREAGVTPEQAIARHKAWMASRLARFDEPGRA